MEKQILRILKSTIGAALLLGSIHASAQTSSKIADCTVAADANNPAQSLQVYFKGGDTTDASQYTVHYTSAGNEKDLSVQNVDTSSKDVLGLQFANFLFAQIHEGHSTNSTLGVMLGAAPQNMTCDAQF